MPQPTAAPVYLSYLRSSTGRVDERVVVSAAIANADAKSSISKIEAVKYYKPRCILRGDGGGSGRVVWYQSIEYKPCT